MILVVFDDDRTEVAAQAGAPCRHRLGDVQIIVLFCQLVLQFPFFVSSSAILNKMQISFSHRWAPSVHIQEPRILQWTELSAALPAYSRQTF